MQSKWGYQTLDVAAEAVANYSAAGIPLEGLFVDIEYMSDNFRTMTFSEGKLDNSGPWHTRSSCESSYHADVCGTRAYEIRLLGRAINGTHCSCWCRLSKQVTCSL
jgi:hypothetical protein